MQINVTAIGDRRCGMKEKDDVPLITLDGYAETHEELERMVQNCKRELDEVRKELGLVR